MDKIKTIFCWFYAQWISKAVNEKTDPLVIVMDKLWASPCKYCFASRVGVAGAGFGALLRLDVWGIVLGALLFATSVFLTYGERRFLCAPKPSDGLSAPDV